MGIGGETLFSVSKRVKGEGEKCRLRSISLDSLALGLEKLMVRGRLIESGSTVKRKLFRDWADKKTSLR
jgi:hypothetical protein